jgi:sodium-dependent dicarboxylate transporter 2/3/5
MASPESSLMIKRRIRYGVVAVATVIAAILLFGPIWVEPIHHATGKPYWQLDSEPLHAHQYVSREAPQRALALFVFCLALWGTNFIALSATGLLVIALLPLIGVASPRQSFAYFGNSAVFFILGVFIMAAAMIRTGLSKRLTLVLLQRFDRHPRLLVAGILLSSAFLSLWMPEHAVAAMMFPIVLEVAESLKLERGRSGYAKQMFLALAYGAAIGGVATFLGGARAPLALGLLRDTFQTPLGEPVYTVSFLEWMRASMPLVIVLTGVALVLLFKFIDAEIDDITPATRMLNERVAQLGPLSRAEFRLAFVGGLTVAAWIGLGHEFDLAVIAVLGAVAISLFRIADWRDIQDYINWGVVLMYGGAIALGSAMSDTHAVLWLAQQIIPGADVSPIAILVIVAGLTILLSSAISNAAAVAVILPVGYGLCAQTVPEINPLAMTYAVGIGSGLAFALPISSPPNAICFSSGYYSMSEVAKYGVPLTVIAWGVFALVMVLVWPLLGIPVMISG